SRSRISGSTDLEVAQAFRPARAPLTKSTDPYQLIERCRVPVEGAAEREVASADRTIADIGPEDEKTRSVALHPDERDLRESQERADDRELTRQHDRRRIGRVAVLERH